MNRRDDHRRKARRWHRLWLWLCLLLLLAGCWYGGLIGRGLRQVLLPRFLPLALGEHMELVQVAKVPLPTEPDRGLLITLSPDYIRTLLRASPVPAGLLPPGLLEAHTVVFARWQPAELAGGQAVPLMLHLHRDAKAMPRVVLRFPAAELNTILNEEFAEDWTDTDDYLFGEYALTYRIWFHSLTAVTLPRAAADPLAPVQFRAQATGRVRYWFEHGVLSARSTGNVRKLVVTFTFIPERQADGIKFDFAATMDALEITADNMAPWLERRLTRSLRRSMERSLNRRRRRERIARRRLPAWLPLDVELDLVIRDAP